MKLNRNSKKWKELYRDCLIQTCVYNGIKKIKRGKPDSIYGYGRETFIDAMPDRIKEAEDYADRLFSAMR